MSEAWGAVVAAAVSGVLAIVVGVLAYKAGRRQVADQEMVAHRAWRRQHRLDAYQQAVAAADAVLMALYRWAMGRDADGESTQDATERLGKAYAAVGVMGPEAMRDLAGQVYIDACAISQLCGSAASGEQRRAEAQRCNDLETDLQNSVEEFVQGAARVVDDHTQ